MLRGVPVRLPFGPIILSLISMSRPIMADVVSNICACAVCARVSWKHEEASDPLELERQAVMRQETRSWTQALGSASASLQPHTQDFSHELHIMHREKMVKRGFSLKFT